MLTHLRIRNFKGWCDTGEIRMAPITLFFGANSSGKSSIGQFLMMLKQTVESPDRRAVFYPGGKTSAVQLGSYLEMVYQRKSDNRVSFEYTWDLSDSMKFKDALSNESYSTDKLTFKAETGLNSSEKQTPIINQIQYLLSKSRNGGEEEDELSVKLERMPNKTEYRVSAQGYNLIRKQGRVWPLRAPVRFYGFPDEVVAYYQNADFVQALNLLHERLFHSIFYLGPLRTKAERLYSWTGVVPESVGYAGENTVAAILASSNRKISLGRKRPTKPFGEVIAHQLKLMGLIEEFKVNPISEQRQEYEVKLRTRGALDFVDLPDVGFGICQVLPVLVECFYAEPGSIIIMEQPEIHLHPSAQSALADVVIDAVKSKEYGEDRKIQLIIETHSEHFLRRLQRRIAENQVEDSTVSAYFADIARTPARLEPLDIDLFGNVKNWPENFFGDEMSDITAQAKAALQKPSGEKNCEEEDVV